MQGQKKYHAFISYSHVDKQYASVIQRSIETLGLPFYKKWQPDVNIFRDERKIPLAGSLNEQILEGLKDSEYLIVIASRNSAQSTWVKEEISNWHQINKDDGGFIKNFNFILVDHVVEWDSENKDFNKLKTTALPLFANRIFKTLPIWANLQTYCKDGKVKTNNANYEWEIAKVKGLLLQKKPDQIIDEVSRSKNIFRVLAGLVILTLVVLATFSFYQKSIAVQQKNIAEKNLIDFKKEEFDRNFKNGNIYFDAQEFCFADSCFAKAAETANNQLYNKSINFQKIGYLDSIRKICKSRCE